MAPLREACTRRRVALPDAGRVLLRGRGRGTPLLAPWFGAALGIMTRVPEKTVPILWSVPPNVETKYATNFVLAHTLDEFFLSFFELAPPIVLGSDEEKARQLEKISALEARCVARIVMDHKRATQLLDVLSRNLKQHAETEEAERGKKAARDLV